MLKPLSFETAVRLFKSWGFVVEPGPRPGEVSLILEQADHRTYAVYEADMLPDIAAVTLRIRWQNGAMIDTITDADQPEHESVFSTLTFQEGGVVLRD